MMTNLEIAVQTIKDSVSALDVGRALGLNIDSHGRCSCPFHNGKDRNLKLFPGNRGYSCFVCHEGGDVIRFVQKYHSGMTFKEAVAWFDSTFHMGLNLNGKIDPEKQRRAEKALQRRKKAQEFEEWKTRMRFDMYLTADEIVRKLEEQRDRNMPTDPDVEWSQEFWDAVRLLPEAKRFTDDCAMECTEVKN